MFLRIGDGNSNVAKPCNEESHGLQEEVYVVMILPKRKVIATAQEEVESNKNLKHIYTVKVKQEIKIHNG